MTSRFVVVPSAVASPVAGSPQDAFISAALEAHTEQATVLRDHAVAELSSARMPTRGDESYRFTNISPLLENQVQAAPATALQVDCPLSSAETSSVRVVNGKIDTESSNLSGIPDGMFVGNLADAPQSARDALGSLSKSSSGVFALLNAATATDVLVVHVAAGVECIVPLHVLVISSSATANGCVAMSSPRLLIIAEAGAKVEVVEEHIGQQDGQGQYFSNSVAEIVLAQKASVSHRFVETDVDGAFNMKHTFVSQAERSSYELTETRLGGKLTRCEILQGFPCAGSKHAYLCGSAMFIPVTDGRMKLIPHCARSCAVMPVLT